jgi:hypothetical protein
MEITPRDHERLVRCTVLHIGMLAPDGDRLLWELSATPVSPEPGGPTSTGI